MTDWKPLLSDFQQKMSNRMEAGFREYGDASFDAEPISLLQEIEEELLDVSNWSFIMWARVQRMKRRLRDGEG